MTLELLALLLADDDTAVAKIGTRSGNDLVPMFNVPLPLEEVTAERVLERVAHFQAKVDQLAAVYDACQPKLITVTGALPANVTAGKFKQH